MMPSSSWILTLHICITLHTFNVIMVSSTPVHHAASVNEQHTHILAVPVKVPSRSWFDFASADAGANVLASSLSISGAAHILNTNDDLYMMFHNGDYDDNNSLEHLSTGARRLSANSIVVQLSEDVTPEVVVLKNIEHYSSGLRHVQVLGSASWPTKKWLLLAEVYVSPRRRAQAFEMAIRRSCRFIKLRFLSCYNSEHLCTLTRLQVFGTPALERVAVHLAETKDADAAVLAMIRARQRLVSAPPLVKHTVTSPVESLSTALSKDQFCTADTIPFAKSLWMLPGYTNGETTSADDSVYSKLLDRLQTIGIRQRLLETAASDMNLQFKPYKDRLNDSITHKRREWVRIDAEQRVWLDGHQKLVVKSQLPILVDELESVVPRVIASVNQAQSDFITLLVIAVFAVVCCILSLLGFLFGLKRGYHIHRRTYPRRCIAAQGVELDTSARRPTLPFAQHTSLFNARSRRRSSIMSVQ